MSTVPGIRIEARDVVRRFVTARGAGVTAVDGVTLSIEPGAYVTLRGRSGSGKTTLLCLLAGFDRPTAGAVLLDDADLAAASRAERVRRTRQIGFVFQGAPMIRRLPLWENVAAGLVPLGVPALERHERSCAVLDRVGLADKAGRRPETLSFGERQRVAVARALIETPRLLLADEPTSNLDAETASIVAETLAAANAAGCTMIVSTHDQRLIEKAARMVRLDAGRIESDTAATLEPA